MSYVKKDEDADQVMIKLDRTSVFQDGTLFPLALIQTSKHSSGPDPPPQLDCLILLPSRLEDAAPS